MLLRGEHFRLWESFSATISKASRLTIAGTVTGGSTPPAAAPLGGEAGAHTGRRRGDLLAFAGTWLVVLPLVTPT